MIRGTRNFEKALGEWSSRAATTKTWDTFKVHFKDAHTKLKEIRGPTIQQADYHHANMFAEQLYADLQLQGMEMLALVQSMVIDDNQPVEEIQPPLHPQREPVANVVMQDNVQAKILRLLRDIAQHNGNNCRRGRNKQEGRGRRGGGNNHNCCTPDNAHFARFLNTLYCHTHGGCNHVSDDCTSKARGHKDNATKENCMGGSSSFCE